MDNKLIVKQSVYIEVENYSSTDHVLLRNPAVRYGSTSIIWTHLVKIL